MRTIKYISNFFIADFISLGFLNSKNLICLLIFRFLDNLNTELPAPPILNLNKKKIKFIYIY